MTEETEEKSIPDLIFESNGFALLSRGMKDRTAYAIMLVLYTASKINVASDVYDAINRYARDVLDDEESG